MVRYESLRHRHLRVVLCSTPPSDTESAAIGLFLSCLWPDALPATNDVVCCGPISPFFLYATDIAIARLSSPFRSPAQTGNVLLTTPLLHFSPLSYPRFSILCLLLLLHTPSIVFVTVSSSVTRPPRRAPKRAPISAWIPCAAFFPPLLPLLLLHI